MQGAVPPDASGATAYAKNAGPVDVISISDIAYVTGNFTAIAGDIYWLNDLFNACAPTGQTIAGLRVTLGDSSEFGGTLRLDGQDVLAGTTTFSAVQFARQTYTTGAGGSQTITLIPQTGTRQPNLDSTLSDLGRETHSPAVQITANVTGSRSVNVMNALTTPPGTDVGIASIVQQMGMLIGWTGWLGDSIKVSGEHPDRLTYTTGANGSQNIVVATQTGTRQSRLPDGTFRVVCGVLCFVVLCLLIAVLQ